MTEEILTKLTANQNRLQAFIFTLTGDRELSRDLLQSTNLVIWQKAEQFNEGTNFLAWAYKIARFQVMAHRKKTSRERVFFSESFLDELALAAERTASEERLHQKQQALTECLKEIHEKHQNVLWRFYRDDWRIRDISDELGKSVSAIEQILSRTRAYLLKCITQRIEASS